MSDPRNPGRLSERLSRPPGTLERVLRGATIIHTPSRPDHRYGNVLVLEASPTSAQDLLRGLKQYRDIAVELDMPSRACLAWEIHDLDARHSAEVAVAVGLRVELADVLIARPVEGEGASRLVEPVPETMWGQLKAMASASDDFADDGLRTWFLEGRLEMVRSGRAQIWGVLVEGSPVAACFSFTSGALSRLDQLLVHPDFRRRGLGSAAIAGIRDRLSTSEMIVMEPQTGNWRSQMYRRLGFGPVGVTVTVVER